MITYSLHGRRKACHKLAWRIERSDVYLLTRKVMSATKIGNLSKPKVLSIGQDIGLFDER